jgi:cell division septation protein DedD
MKSTPFFCVLLIILICGPLPVFAASPSAEETVPVTTAKAASEEASKKESVIDSISYLKSVIPGLPQPAEKRSSYVFLGSIQEQLGLYTDAGTSYAAAAGIAAGDAAGMPKRSSEQLVIDAVRCALSAGDCDIADRYLNSAVRGSSDETIAAYVKLYEQWSALCRAEKKEDTVEPVALLKTFADLPSMKAVRPAVLLTLWHETGDNAFAERIKKEFPDSLESAIVKGSVQLMPAPFWYFAPRIGSAVPEIQNEPSSPAVVADTSAADAATDTLQPSVSKKTSASLPESSEKIVRQQLGLFKEQANATALVDQLKMKGFAARITTEKRPSGTTYYIVVVDENKDGSIGAELRNAGFECYPVFE